MDHPFKVATGGVDRREKGEGEVGGRGRAVSQAGRQAGRQADKTFVLTVPEVRLPSLSPLGAPSLPRAFVKMMEKERTNERTSRGSNFRRSERLSEMFIPFLPSALTRLLFLDFLPVSREKGSEPRGPRRGGGGGGGGGNKLGNSDIHPLIRSDGGKGVRVKTTLLKLRVLPTAIGPPRQGPS